MQQTIEDSKIGKQAIGENAVEVELQISEFDQARGIAQQAQHTAVGDQAVEFILEIEIFLHHGVGRHAQDSPLGLTVEPCRFAAADDVERGVATVGDAVRDGIGLAIEFDTTRLVFELVAEQTQERDHPLLTGLGGSWGVGSECFEPALEDAPVVLDVGPGAGDLVLDPGGALQAEICRPLTGGVFKPVEDVRGEDSAFDANARVVHREFTRF